MKATSWTVQRKGIFKKLELQETQLPEPSENQVQIQVQAIGMNYADIFAVNGLYSATPRSVFTPGLEFSGVVLKTGKGVRKFKTGDSIMGVTRFGAYTTALNVDADYLSLLPKGWSPEEGAGFLVQGLTAYYALFFLGNLQNEQTVLIHSAAGGVGILANRMAKTKNAYTIGMIGSKTKERILKEEHYDAIVYRNKEFAKDLQKVLMDRALHLVLECSGGEYFRDSYQVLAPQGRLVTYGSANFTPHTLKDWLYLPFRYLTRPRLDPLSMISSNKSVMGFNLIWLWNEKKQMIQMKEELLHMNLPPQLISKLYPFRNMQEAMNDFSSGKTIGKLILITP